MGYRNNEDRKKYRRKWLQSSNRPRASCHPDRPHRARGLCSQCYERWLYKNSEKYRKIKQNSVKKWRTKNVAHAKFATRNAKLKKKYGIDEAEYQRMLIAQAGRCKICRQLPQGKQILHVDHSHDTGKVRGLLCSKCNGLLAMVEEFMRKRKTKWIIQATRYLKIANS